MSYRSVLATVTVVWMGAVARAQPDDPLRGVCPNPPQVTGQPGSPRTCPTGPVGVSISASGLATPFSYQWQILRAGVWTPLADGVYAEAGGFSLTAMGVLTTMLTVSAIHLGSHPAAISVRCRIVDGCLQTVTTLPGTIAVCPADADCDGTIRPADVGVFVSTWAASLQQGTLAGDFDGNNAVNNADIGAFVSAWFSSLTTGC